MYAVICGYELDPCDLMREGGHGRPQIIAEVPFPDAAHITRTLLEKGESDMSYYMLPLRMYSHWSNPNHDSHNDDGARLPKAAPGSIERATVERLFQRYLDAVHEDSGLAVDEEWTDEELFAHICTALNTEPA